MIIFSLKIFNTALKRKDNLNNLVILGPLVPVDNICYIGAITVGKV